MTKNKWKYKFDSDSIKIWRKALESGGYWEDKFVNDALDEIEKLNKHIEQMSCCCAGCTKHNLNIKEGENGL